MLTEFIFLHLLILIIREIKFKFLKLLVVASWRSLMIHNLGTKYLLVSFASSQTPKLSTAFVEASFEAPSQVFLIVFVASRSNHC
jgi:hypothetical protein